MVLVNVMNPNTVDPRTMPTTPRAFQFGLATIVIYCAVSLLHAFFAVDLFPLYTDNEGEVVVIGGLLGAFLSVLWSLFAAIRYRRIGLICLVPAMTLAVTTGLHVFVPFAFMRDAIDFRMNRSERERVVEMVRQGALAPTDPPDRTWLTLPPKPRENSSFVTREAIERRDWLITGIGYSPTQIVLAHRDCT